MKICEYCKDYRELGHHKSNDEREFHCLLTGRTCVAYVPGVVGNVDMNSVNGRWGHCPGFDLPEDLAGRVSEYHVKQGRRGSLARP